MVDTEDRGRGVVIRLVLTASAEQYAAVLPDFQYFVWTVRPDTGET
jgi:hypothetical protein